MTVRNQRKMAGIPRGVISRLPVYYRYLSGLSQAQEKISSAELGKALSMTAAQIRSDLSYFGSFGLHGYGYRVDQLKQAIAEILGLDRTYQLVLVGAGNLGRALATYRNFRHRGFIIGAIFDNDPQIIGQELAGVQVQSIDNLEDYLRTNACDIAVICTPREASQAICDRLVGAGVKAIWNFSPIHLQVPDDVIVEHIHLTDSLLQLSFQLRQRSR
ncbi:MAG: redox-sensing transcriptional repressor Rex [Limnochordia bacterium]|nr:redox-sensing transcriptional repressor Rex [Bacillota bacterium]HOB08844.1 redox-sensing transcriptional repressor Rex [Limnochordia bacterium]HPT92404.1 redox-sensing transcriptional repressor Rex [Limnochordia bacterium]HPZ30434.1 redox-sensing transcriptional repressor Rex [Limnochordia bacterium]HQD70740.1 redox-sensing transcriptional repressor Rex [Limnochordia bacterium]